MCIQFTMLASYDAAHYIAQCEHGTLHLVWQSSTIRLHPRDLVPTIKTLQTITPDVPYSLYQNGLIVLTLPDQGVTLWLGNAGLGLSYEGFALLRELLCQAALSLPSFSGSSAQPSLRERTAAYMGPATISRN